MLNRITAKLREAAFSVLPIVVIVLVLERTIARVSGPVAVLFFVSAAVLIVGMALFALGAEIAMTPMGELVGARMTQKRSLPFLISAGFLMGRIWWSWRNRCRPFPTKR